MVCSLLSNVLKIYFNICILGTCNLTEDKKEKFADYTIDAYLMLMLSKMNVTGMILYCKNHGNTDETNE